MISKSFYIIVIFLIFSNIAKSEVEQSKSDSINFQALKFKYMLERIIENHPNEFSIQEIADSAFKAMLQSVDKHSNYFSVDEMNVFRERTSGSRFGVGLTYSLFNDTITIIGKEKYSPADSSIIEIGDKLIFVDEEKVIGKSHQDVKNLIEGESGQKVSLIFQKAKSNELYEVNLIRTEIPSTSINSSFILRNTDTGYININRFSNATHGEFTEEVKKLLQFGMKELILDLRDNGGGDINTTINIIDDFLSTEDTLAFLKSANPEFELNYIGNLEEEYKNIPLVILVNENSASGSEMIAGILQEFDRAIIIGEITYGKGSAQKIYNLSDSSAFKVTVAHYYTAIGRNLESKNEDEDVELPLEIELRDDIKQDLLEKLKKFGSQGKLPSYKSKNGRDIIGGNGIMPDVYAKADTNSTLTQFLIKRGIFLEFALQYYLHFGDEFNSKLEGEDDYINRFQVNDALLKSFAQFAASRKTWNNEMFTYSKDKIIMFIKAYIGYIFWGQNTYRKVLINEDKVVNAAIENLSKAKELLNNYHK